MKSLNNLSYQAERKCGRKKGLYMLVVNSYLEINKRSQEFYASMEASLNVANETLLIMSYLMELYERNANKMEEDDDEEIKCLRMLGDILRFKAKGGDVLDKEYIRVTRLVYEKKEEAMEYKRFVEELKKAKARIKSLCNGEIFAISKPVYDEQILLLERSMNQKHQLQKKLVWIKRRRKASNVMFGIGFFTVPVLTALVMVVPVPSAIEVLVGAFSAMVGSLGKWCSFLWNKRESEAEFQKNGLSTIQVSSYVVIKNTDNLRVLIERMFSKVEHLVELTELMRSVEQEDKEMMDKVKVLVMESMEMTEEAKGHVSKCNKDITYSSQLVSERVISIPNGSTPKRRSWMDIFM